MMRFTRYDLRTTDVPAARAFYDELFGNPFGEALTIGPLPEIARARGAKPHWLGHIVVDDVAETSRRFLAEGAQPLGPTALRDPFGAIVALTSTAAPPTDRIAWHVHCSQDENKAFAAYASLFGWAAKTRHDLGADGGRLQEFAWSEGGDAVGTITDLARQPQIHAQWLFFFRVPSLDAATEVVRARGGLALPSRRMPNGALSAACDDPQGGAFGLYECAR